LSTIEPDCWYGGSTTLEKLRGEQSTHITSSVNSRTEQGTGYPGLDTKSVPVSLPDDGSYVNWNMLERLW